MDARAYAFFVEELQNRGNADFSGLPIEFAKGIPKSDDSYYFALIAYLDSQIASPSSPISFKKLHTSDFYNTFIFKALLSIAEALSSKKTNEHDFRTNGIQLIKFLSQTVEDKESYLVKDDSRVTSMFCFFIEAFMYLGWCPNSFEQIAKRAAHSYFMIAKRFMHHTDTHDVASVLGYMCGAWLLAQKTEGIRDLYNKPSSVTINNYEFNYGTLQKSILIRRTPNSFYILDKKQSLPAHPYRAIMNDNKLGLFLSKPFSCIERTESQDISRNKITGIKNLYTFQLCGFKQNFIWTNVVLFYENTVYRIDSIPVPDSTTISEPFSLFGKFEGQGKPKQYGKNCFICLGDENWVIKFIESPGMWDVEFNDNDGLIHFKHSDFNFIPGKTIRFITAWAYGKGITAIRETKLLGIYD